MPVDIDSGSLGGINIPSNSEGMLSKLSSVENEPKNQNNQKRDDKDVWHQGNQLTNLSSSQTAGCRNSSEIFREDNREDSRSQSLNPGEGW